MSIQYQFDPDKAIEAIAYLTDRLSSVEKVKLTKLLYIADRDHFIKHGRPITGDRLVAMRWGPVSSNSLDLLNGDDCWGGPDIYQYLHLDDNTFYLKRKPNIKNFNATETAILDDVLQVHGDKPTWKLVEETHEYLEYKDVYVEGTSTPISYELILKHYGGSSRFRNNRAVISQEMAEHMICPFREREPDW